MAAYGPRTTFGLPFGSYLPIPICFISVALSQNRIFLGHERAAKILDVLNVRLRIQVAIDPLPTVSGRTGVVIVNPHGQVELFDSYAGKNRRGNYRGNRNSRIGNISIKIGVFRVNSMVSGPTNSRWSGAVGNDRGGTAFG